MVTKKAFLVWATAAILALSGSAAWPYTITFDDYPGSPIGTNDTTFAVYPYSSDDFMAPYGGSISRGWGYEQGSITIYQSAVHMTPNLQYNLALTDASGAVSDYLVFTTNNTGYNLSATYYSDYETEPHFPYGPPDGFPASGYATQIEAATNTVSFPCTLYTGASGTVYITMNNDVDRDGPVVPLPPSALLLGSGLLGLGAWRRFKKS